MSHKKIFLLLTLFVLIINPIHSVEKIKKKKLKIVFMFGQSNMVGMVSPAATLYHVANDWKVPAYNQIDKTLLEDLAFWSNTSHPTLQMIYNELKWQRRGFRQHIPKEQLTMRKSLLRVNSAIRTRIMREVTKLLPEEDFTNAEECYQEIIEHQKKTQALMKEIRKRFLGGKKITEDDYNIFLKELELLKKANKSKSVEETRLLISNLFNKHFNLPIGKRAHLYGFGSIGGSKGEGIFTSTSGPVQVGYGGRNGMMGPEYAAGITLEHMVDAPILIAKMSWGGTSVATDWRAPSLDGVETATEKSRREKSNIDDPKDFEKYEMPALETFKPRNPPVPTGNLSWIWEKVSPQVKAILANPGDYYPDYDENVGYEVAGLIWFQGWNDQGNTAYGELLTHFIRDMRILMKTPEMPVVLGMMGTGRTKIKNGKKLHRNTVNLGMLKVASDPEFKNSVKAVETEHFYPYDMNLLSSMYSAYSKRKSVALKKKQPFTEKFNGDEYLAQHWRSNQGYHYMGSSKFMIQAGDAFAKALVSLMKP